MCLEGEHRAGRVGVDDGPGQASANQKHGRGIHLLTPASLVAQDQAVPMTVPFMVYGASGYTGRLLVEAALSGGLRPILAGRNETTLAPLAERLGLEYRVVRLGDPPTLDAALRKVRVVLHAAGPFSATARPMVDACLRTGTHYLDITGEVRVFEAVAARDAEAKSAGVMLLPGVGFDVVPSDCLAAHMKRRLPDAMDLKLYIGGLANMSRGT